MKYFLAALAMLMLASATPRAATPNANTVMCTCCNSREAQQGSAHCTPCSSRCAQCGKCLACHRHAHCRCCGAEIPSDKTACAQCVYACPDCTGKCVKHCPCHWRRCSCCHALVSDKRPCQKCSFCRKYNRCHTHQSCSCDNEPGGGSDGGYTPPWPPSLNGLHAARLHADPFVCYNNDDDNANRVIDCRDTVCTGDNDLVSACITLSRPEFPGHTLRYDDISVSVTYPSQYLRFWDARGARILPCPFSFSGISTNVLIEGIAPTAAHGVPVTISYSYTVGFCCGNYDTFVPVAGSMTTNLVVYTCDLDIDSDNNNVFNLPSRSPEEDVLEQRQGFSFCMGKHLHQNDFDFDNDGIPDFIDGIGKVSRSGDIAGGKFAPMVFQLTRRFPSEQPYVAFSYSASDPRLVPEIEDVQVAQNFKESSLPPGFLRIWKKNAAQPRNFASVAAGGDYIPTDTRFPLSTLSPDANGNVTLYVEAVRASTNWGDTITVRAYPDAATTIPYAEDAVKVTATRTLVEVYVWRPYIKTSGGRCAFELDESSPQAYFKSFTNGFLNPDNEHHERAAYMGHAFARLDVKTPSSCEVHWLGKTGGRWFEVEAQYDAFRAGTLQWTPASGRADATSRLVDLYNRYFVRAVDPINNYPGTTPSPAKMVAMHEFRITPKMAGQMLAFNTQHDYSSYGLDIATTKGGCGSFVGQLLDAASVAEQAVWLFDRSAPVVPLHTLPGWSVWFALTGCDNQLGEACAEFCGTLPGYAHNAPLTATWGVPASSARPLRYHDPAKMARHIDVLNNKGAAVNDRGVTIYYYSNNYWSVP